VVVLLIIIAAALFMLRAKSSEEVPITDKNGKPIHIFVCKGPFYCEDNRNEVRMEKLPDGGYY
jgi:hypothetical protein